MVGATSEIEKTVLFQQTKLYNFIKILNIIFKMIYRSYLYVKYIYI